MPDKLCEMTDYTRWKISTKPIFLYMKWRKVFWKWWINVSNLKILIYSNWSEQVELRKLDWSWLNWFSLGYVSFHSYLCIPKLDQPQNNGFNWYRHMMVNLYDILSNMKKFSSTALEIVAINALICPSKIRQILHLSFVFWRNKCYIFSIQKYKYI